MFKKIFQNQTGLAPLVLLLIAASGVVLLLLLSNTADFHQGLFKDLFGRKSSFAAGPGVVFVDQNNQPITQTT